MVNIKGLIANYPSPVRFRVEPCGYEMVVRRLSHPGDTLGRTPERPDGLPPPFHNPWSDTWSKVVSNQTAIDRELIQNADLIVSNHPRWSSRQDGDVVRSITVGLGDDVINGAWVNVPCYINGNATTVRGWVKPKGFERPMWVSLSLEGMSSVDTKIDQIKW